MCWLLKYKFTHKTYSINKQAPTETSKWQLWTTEPTLVQLTRFLTLRMSWQGKWCSTMMQKKTGEDMQLYNDDMVVITNNSSRSSSRQPTAIFKSFSFHLLCSHTCQPKPPSYCINLTIITALRKLKATQHRAQILPSFSKSQPT